MHGWLVSELDSDLTELGDQEVLSRNEAASAEIIIPHAEPKIIPCCSSPLPAKSLKARDMTNVTGMTNIPNLIAHNLGEGASPIGLNVMEDDF